MAITTTIKRQLLPVIAALIAGVSWGQKFIATQVLPEVNTYGQKYIYETVGNEGRVLVSGAKRGKGAETKAIPVSKTGSVEGTLDEYALEARIDYTDIHAAEVQDLIRGAVGSPDGLNSVDRLRYGRTMWVHHDLSLLKEQAVANLVFSDAAYENAFIRTGESVVDFGAAGIIAQLLSDRRAVEKTYGFAPDRLILGWNKFVDLCTNDEILSRITGGATVANPAEVDVTYLKRILGVRDILVGTAVVDTTIADPGAAAGTQTELWNPDEAAYIFSGQMILPSADGTPSVSTADLATPAFGKIFMMNVPETQVPYSVQAYDKYGNGKVEANEVTEFYNVAQVMKAGVRYKAA